MLLTGIVFVCFPILFGTGIWICINRTSSDEKMHLWEAYLYGFTGSIGIFEIGHLAGIFTKCTLTDSGRIITWVIVGASICSVAVLFRKIRTVVNLRKDPCKLCIPCMLFFLLMAVQIYCICSVPVIQTDGDITLETVNSFLVTDMIYEVSPLTGKVFGGAPLRYEILCLPTIYTLLCKWSGLEPAFIVGTVIPSAVVCLAYMAYYLLGRTLFGKENGSKEKSWWFMVIVSAVFFLCEQSVYMDGYGILHAGHLGTTIRNGVLIPLVLYAVLEKKWILACFCILAEACIVWTFWGVGMSVVVLAGGVLAGALLQSQKICRMFPDLTDEEGNLG